MKTASRKNDKINWITSIALILFHLGAVGALFMFTWKALAVVRPANAPRSNICVKRLSNPRWTTRRNDASCGSKT